MGAPTAKLETVVIVSPYKVRFVLFRKLKYSSNWFSSSRPD